MLETNIINISQSVSLKNESYFNCGCIEYSAVFLRVFSQKKSFTVSTQLIVYSDTMQND